ncbi:MAG: glucuronyl hydrolase [Chitinophagaceae bacterium]|nr:glycoside hydrolase family 88 protein [Sphingobacteriales bacterium]OJV98672.1 MAG: glucuronyl hydrolase [Sphingobacteriales bacterium 44-61]TXJ27966.1 MAG: glucuronyl hydrolase [Chitinophagaceae bacterium]
MTVHSLRRQNLIPVVLLLCLSCLSLCTYAQGKKKIEKLIQKNMELAARQYKFMASLTPADSMPRTYDAAQDKLVSSDTRWWTSGFFPASLWYIYSYTKDTAIRSEAERRLALEEKEKYLTSNHDVGFMIFCSFGNAYKITHNPDYRDVCAVAAETLIKRYKPSIKAIQSWQALTAPKSPVIIDNMMNLELLNWVSDEWREPKYKAIAIAHANTTIKNHFRADNSSYHVVEYDPATGKVLEKKTAQGYSDESAWARGQAWGLYGYTMMYRFTTEPTYLEQARKIAAFILNHPNLPADGVPYWDFNAPVDKHTLRDASAASIMASALLELAQYTEGAEKTRYISMAEKILTTLSSKTYLAKYRQNGGFLLKHGVGNLPGKSEVDVPLTYGDYYFIEAMLRYKQWYL